MGLEPIKQLECGRCVPELSKVKMPVLVTGIHVRPEILDVGAHVAWVPSVRIADAQSRCEIRWRSVGQLDRQAHGFGVRNRREAAGRGIGKTPHTRPLRIQRHDHANLLRVLQRTRPITHGAIGVEADHVPELDARSLQDLKLLAVLGEARVGRSSPVGPAHGELVLVRETRVVVALRGRLGRENVVDELAQLC